MSQKCPINWIFLLCISIWLYSHGYRSFLSRLRIIPYYPPSQNLRWGDIVMLSVRASVRPSVRPSVRVSVRTHISIAVKAIDLKFLLWMQLVSGSEPSHKFWPLTYFCSGKKLYYHSKHTFLATTLSLLELGVSNFYHRWSSWVSWGMSTDIDLWPIFGPVKNYIITQNMCFLQ